MTDPADILGLLLASGALALLAGAVVSLARRDRALMGPTTRRFCRRCGIRRGERKLLGRMAVTVGAPTAAAVLVSRGCFDTAARRYLARATPAEARRLAEIRGRVFE